MFIIKIKKIALFLSIVPCSLSYLCAQDIPISISDTLREVNKQMTPKIIEIFLLNQYNKDSLKTGLWIENNGLDQLYYRKGEKNGIQRIYDERSGKIKTFTIINETQKIKYSFDSGGTLFSVEKSLPKKESQVTFYLPNGEKKNTTVTTKDVSQDSSEMAKRRPYNAKGKLIEEVKYDKPLYLILQTMFKRIAEEMIKSKNVNQYEKDSLKTGFWIENDGFREFYYKKGKRNGLVKFYDELNGKLVIWGELANNKRVGTWCYFALDTGELEIMERMIPIEKEIVQLETGAKIEFKYKAYRIFFYPGGEKMAEGVILYTEPLSIDNFNIKTEHRIGTWKFYDEKGNRIENKK